MYQPVRHSTGSRTLSTGPGQCSLWLLVTILLIGSCQAQARCKDYNALNQLFWGDLHVHTGLSVDAYMSGNRTGPEDAYRFALGEAIPAPNNPDKVRIERPLDFAAVTDHVTDSGATYLCTTPGATGYNSEQCQNFRSPVVIDKSNIRELVKQLVAKTGGQLSSPAICGPQGKRCWKAQKTVWQRTQEAASQFLDDSDECSFTTFVAYEYTATPDFTKLHRNVIFRNDIVLPQPISYAEEPDERILWQRLQTECIDAGNGCDVLAIPHNPNLSNGKLFTPLYPPDSTPKQQADLAALRARLEPVLEMMQLKGASECRNGLWNVLGETDELCDWEQIRPASTPDCQERVSSGALLGDGCLSRLDYGRYALVEGIKEKKRLGVNPYKLGFIASTDTHASTPGAVEEWRNDVGVSVPNPRPGRNGGGLVAVWAEENSREAIFKSLRRREVYGTSGPRIGVRYFAGATFEPALCADPKLLQKAYGQGVPMGSTLTAESLEQGPPSFLVMAQKDQGTQDYPGNQLQRAQIIKGWTDDAGNIHQQVVDIAGGPNQAGINTSDCRPQGIGHDQLCAVWQDPDFDSSQDAVYYARIVENPSCRSTGWHCALTREDERPTWCDDSSTSLVTQERAWTSPIWYTAPPGQ
jgi:Protein of unknown function (DUF3604)